MDKESDSGRPRRLIDMAAKTRFLAALRAGAARESAALEAGFPLKSLYGARRRDPVFRLGWRWALELSAADEAAARRAASPPTAGDDPTVRIAPQGKRLLQRRRMRSVRFTEARQQVFLDHFAGTADAHAAAAAAGLCYSTVRAHYRRNPEFAALWHEALRLAYAMLEAEALRQRLAVQRRLAASLEPTGEMAHEFERLMKLLARYDRRDGRIAARESPGRRRAWTFEEAIASLDKRLRSLGLRSADPPLEGEGGGGPSPAPEDGP